MSRPRPIVVGILNCTPDSFHDGGRFADLAAQVKRVEEMCAEGADWIDIGGESTRPGAPPVSIEEELSRVLPIIREIGSQVPVSIDTSKPEVARSALGAGARILNDVTGLSSSDMAALSADADAVVIMHSRGTPRSMGALTQYSDIVEEVRDWLLERAALSRSTQTWLDPGIGFAKTSEQSLLLLRQTSDLVRAGYPVYIGASRKSFIGRTLNLPSTESRLAGSIAAACMAFERGAQAFRVHDIAPTRQALDLIHIANQPLANSSC